MTDEAKTRDQLISELQEREITQTCTLTELRKSEQRLQAFFNATNSPTVLIDPEGTMVSLNKAFARSHGRTVEELVGQAVTGVMEPSPASLFREYVERAIETGCPVSVRDAREGCTKDYSFYPLLDTDGAINAVGVGIRDVTEAQRTQQGLQDEKQKFQLLFEEAPFGMLMVAEDGKVEHMNRTFTEMFGYRMEDIPDGRSWSTVAYPDPDYRRHVIEAWKAYQGAASPSDWGPRHFLVSCKNGSQKIIQFTGVKLRSGEHVIACEDITSLTMAQEALRRSEEMLQNILSASPAAISYVEDGILKWTNHAMTEMFLYENEKDYLGKKAKDFYASREEYGRVLDAFKKGLRDGKPVEVEARFRRRDGSCFWARVKVSPLKRATERRATISVIADVTATRQAEEELRQSQHRYRMLVEESFDGIFVQKGSKISFANSRLHAMLGYADGDLAGLDHWLIYHPDFQEITRDRALARMRGEPAPAHYEVKLQRKDGSCFDGELNARPVEVDGQPGVQVWIRDITEQKQAELALRESEERFRRLSDAAEEGIAIHDRGIIVDANEALARMFGYEVSDLIGTSAERLATRESWQTIRQNVLQGHEKPFEAVGIREDGSTLYCQMVGRPYPHMGKTLGVVCLNDITERKRAEQALRLSREEFRSLYEASKRAEELYRSLLNSSADAVVVCDVEARVQYVNDVFTRIFGWTKAELQGQWIPYVPDCESEGTREIIERVMALGTPCSGMETKRYTKDGRLLQTSLSVSRYHDHEGRPAGMLMILRDITESKRLEEQLRQAVKMEAIGRLAGGVAHDFNNLLTAIMGYGTMLTQELPPQASQQDKAVQIIRAAERAAALTQQLLAFGRKQVLEIRPLNLNLVVAEFEDMLRRIIGETVQVVTVLDSGVCTVHADAGQIEQILMNLAVNARDAMPDGGRLTIETTSAELDPEYVRNYPELAAGRYVLLVMSDTGRGMDSETITRIFDPFFTTKEKGLGTGLGLSTVYGIMKQHRGHVTVYSEPGRGTTFKIYLPSVDSTAEIGTKHAAPVCRSCGTETILVVEDEEIVRSLACEALEGLGYTTLAASDPDEAQAISSEYQGPIHALLTDVVLPRMDGKSLFGILARDRPTMKVLYVSGYTENFIVHHGVLDRGVHFMQKPFTIDNLARKLREILDGTPADGQ
jgi:two-component system, cell cycle sensor histidine kinase and response regulator CckA